MVSKRAQCLGSIALLSVATGLAVTYLAIHAPPKPQFERYGSYALDVIRKEVGLGKGRYLPATHLYEEMEKFYYLLVRIFMDLCEKPFGKGAFLLIFSMTAPAASFATTEAVKPHKHYLLGGIAVTTIFLIGQLICIGAALPIFYIPALAYVRCQRSHEVHPQRAFSAGALPVLQVMQLATGVPGLLTVLVPTNHKYFFAANTWFQFFPVAMIALSFYAMVADNKNSVSSHAVADMYRKGRISSTLLYWTGLYLMYPTLKYIAEGGRYDMPDAVKLILWDAVGIFFTLVYMVLIDMAADADPNAHAKNAQGPVTGTLKALFVSILFGPGTAMNSYLAAREDNVAPLHLAAAEAKAQ